MLPYLQYLPAFEAAARLGSVRQAAGELNLSPSAVSLQLKKLGEATGIALFRKSGRNVVLTQAGRDFSQAVAISLGQIDTATRTSRRAAAGEQPVSLSVSVPTALGIAWLTAAIIGFAEGHGISKLSIDEAMTAAEVDWTRNDIAVVYDNPPFTGKHWRLLGEVRLSAVCAPTLLSRLDLRNRERKLSAVTLLHEDDGAQWRRWQAQAGIAWGGESDVYFDSFGIVLQAARDGFGVALSDEVVSARDLDEGRLVQPLQIGVAALHNYYCLCPEAKRDSAEIDYFINWLIGESSGP